MLYKDKMMSSLRYLRQGLHQLICRIQNKRAGKLGIGYGASQDKIGPEYGFGLSIAQKVKGPILLIKTSWGGKSLNYNSSILRRRVSFERKRKRTGKPVEEIKQNVGQFYNMMNEHVHGVYQL